MKPSEKEETPQTSNNNAEIINEETALNGQISIQYLEPRRPQRIWLLGVWHRSAA